jgi:hypothetical protein
VGTKNTALKDGENHGEGFQCMVIAVCQVSLSGHLLHHFNLSWDPKLKEHKMGECYDFLGVI